jgi:SseB protein N-terminal domain
MSETPTALDRAFAAMDGAPEDEALRLRFYERLADAELFLLLVEEPAADADDITPQIFPVENQEFVLVFDREERLAEFSAGVAALAVLSGRNIALMLAGSGIGMAVNLAAPSSILIPGEAVGWLSETLGTGPEEVEERPEEFMPPVGLPEAVIASLDTKLAMAGGMARMAYLCAVTYRGGRASHLLAIIDPVPGAEPALAQAVGEALIFSGIEAGVMDVGFFKASDPICAKLARVGLRFDLPAAERATEMPGSGPGMDPTKPPRLR